SLFDRLVSWPGECRSLRAHGWMRIGAIRRRFQKTMASWGDSIAVYHDGWGVAWLADVDGMRRRIVYLHSERSHADDLIRLCGPWVDGFISVSQSYADRV